LNQIWRDLVEEHFKGQVDQNLVEDLDFDVESFRKALWMDIREGAYERYAHAWATIHNKKSTITLMQSDRKKRRQRRIAAQNRKVGLLEEEQRLNRRGDGNKRDAEGSGPR